MDDLISRAAVIDALEKVAELFPWKVPGTRDSYDHYNEGWNDAIGRAEIEIEELPSAQPEIVRCKDCKHKYVEDMVWHCPFGLMGGENFFCGYGSLGTVERRTDE